MKTFRFSLVALVATALFTACTNEVVVESKPISGAQEISFRLQGGTPETRTTATTNLNIDAFVVYGADDVTTAASANLFDSVTVARRSDDVFDYNPKKYYSIGAATASFFAYSPVSANISSFANVDPLANASFNYEVKVPNATGNTVQEDLLVAGTDLASITTTPVALNFTHALSRIFVKATNSLTENVVITKLTLKGLKSKGTITGTPANPTWAWAWSAQSDTISYHYILAETGVAVKAGINIPTLVTSMEQGMMVIPQAVVVDDGDGLYNGLEFALEVTYDVANLTDQKAHVLFTSPQAFALNNQYAIILDFTGGTNLIEIKFTVNVNPFGTPIDVP